MRRPLVSLLALGSLVLFGSPAALAHGGQYRGPAGEVPPDSRQPEDPPPPDSGGNTPTPPDGGGSTPTPPDGGGSTPTPPDGGDGPPPAPPPDAGVPGPGPGTGTRTGRSPRRAPPSFESWLFWWNYNKDGIVDPRRRLRSGPAASSGNIGVVLEATGRNDSRARDLTAREIESKVVPLLEEYARDGKVNFDIQSAAVLSLAKFGREDQVPLMMEMARNDGADPYHKVVEESAALALGILQDRSPAVREFLAGIATDASARTRTRCFAIVSLGLLGEPDAPPGAHAGTLAVLRALVTADEPNRDIARSALLATGLLGDPAAIPDLLEWLHAGRAGANRLDDLTLSFAAAALGKIGRPGLDGPESREVLEALRAPLVRGGNRLTRYAAVIAHGQIAPRGGEKVQRECVEVLSDIVKSAGRGGIDEQAARFALVALGRIAGAPAAADGTGGAPAAVRDRALRTLVEALGGRAGSRSFAALGLGLAGMDRDAGDRVRIAETVRGELPDAARGGAERLGALVIALGMLRDAQAAPTLVRWLEDRSVDARLRGHCAVALGLIGDGAAREPVRRVLAEKADRDLRVDTAVAAGLLGDREATPTLVGILQDPKSSQFVLGSVALALGRIGDRRAVDPLARILRDPENGYPDLTRALAAVALGQIGDRRDAPVLSRVSRDVNYRAGFDALSELLTIL